MALSAAAPAAHAAPVVYDARISAVEVLQVAQYPEIQVRSPAAPNLPVRYSGVALRQGMRTFVRVYVNTGPNGPTVPGIGMNLRAYELRSGNLVELTGGPLAPYTRDAQVAAGGGDFANPQDSERDDPRGAYLFELPLEWTLPGNGPATQLQLGLLTPPANAQFAECTALSCRNNNLLSVNGLTFRQMCCIDMAVAKIEVTMDGQRFGPTQSPATILGRATSLLPVGVRMPSAYQETIDGDPAVYSRSGGVAQMDTTKFQTAVETLRVKTGADIAVAIGPSNSNLAAGGYWWAFVRQGLTLSALMHETEHALGRLHAGRVAAGASPPPGCSTFDSFAETWSPNQLGMIDGSGIFPDGRFLTLVAGQLRWSDYPVFMSRTQDPSDFTARSANAYDHQSYCGFAGDTRWTSPRAWDTIVDVWRTGRFSCSREQDFEFAPKLGAYADRYCNSIPIGTRGAPRIRVADPVVVTAQSASTLAVSATLDPAGAVAIEEVRPLRVPGAGGADSSYELVVRDAGGAELSRSPLAATTQHSHEGAALPTLLAGAADVALERAARVEIVTGGAVVAFRDRSPNAPAARFRSPRRGALVGRSRTVDIRWTSSDADGDRLSTRLEWSADGGRSWRPVATGPDGGRVRLPSDYFAGTAKGLLRLHVSDGFNETVVVSPRFATVHRPPTVRITTPRSGGAFRRATPVAFAAEASDERNRPIPARRIRWFDGPRLLGRGPGFSVDDLRRGSHTIRAVVTDGAGRRGQASIRVRILR